MSMTNDELVLGESESMLGFRATLVKNALDRALTADVRTSVMKQQVTLLISAVNEAWASALMEPLAKRFSRIAVRQAALDDGGSTGSYIPPHIFRRAPPKRTQDKEDADLATALSALRGGASVIGVFSPTSAPLAIMAELHDLRIEIPRPNLADIQAAYRQATGNELTNDMPAALDGGDLDALDWLIRPRDTPESIVARLKSGPANAVFADDIPSLSDLHGYGAAMDWALDVQRTLARIRAGEPGVSLADLPRGMLLVGPPGVGKTVFAKALAKTLRIKSVLTSASAWLSSGDSHLGAVIRAMRDDVLRATTSPPALLFIDECDSITDRDQEASSSTSWWINFVNALLTALDGAVSTPGLVVVGAANNGDRVDKALKRSGRLETLIEIGLPDLDAREAIFAFYLKGALDRNVIAAAAFRAEGRSGADIRKIVRDARAAAADEGALLAKKHLFRAISPRRQRTDEERRIVALHEAGHALVAHLLGRRVVAIDLDQAVTHLDAPPPIFTDAFIETAMICFMGGRAADAVLGGGANSGAGGGPGSDIAMATGLAAARRRTFGFQGSLWGGSMGQLAQLIQNDAELRGDIEEDLQRAYGRAVELILENASAVQLLADALLEAGFLSGSEVEARLRSVL
jgi:cell division protease FtsH